MDAINRIASSGVRNSLEHAWRNQRAIANNIANANTPGFQPERIEMELLLPENEIHLEQADSRHLAASENVQAVYKNVPATDFSLDSEMGEMAKNNLFYQTLVETVMRRNQMSRTVLEGR